MSFVKENESPDSVAIEIIGSIDRAIQLFNYHICEAKEANDRISPKTPLEAFELVITPTAKIEPLNRDKITIQANVQAAAQCSRSIHDIFAQLVNRLVLEEQIPIHVCDISKVAERLGNSPLKEQLQKLMASPQYDYVNALVNTLKHRNLVPFGAQILLENGEAGVHFKSFEYRNRQYPMLWAQEVMENVLDVKNEVVASGALLNRHLGA